MKIKRTWYDIGISAVCLILLLGMTAYLVIRWGSLPDQVPGHYNAHGEVTRWGSKGELWTLPIVGWIIYIGISVLERFPSAWNTGVTVTEKNKERVYRLLKSMIAGMKLIMVLAFTFIQINSIRGTTLPSYFTALFLILVFGEIIFYIVRLIRIK